MISSVKIFGAVLWLCVVPWAWSAEKPWVEVRSEHFRVVCNGSEKQARHVAQGFEIIHNVFAQSLSRLRTDSGAEVTILGARDEQTMKTLLPAFWAAKGHGKPAGVFIKGWEKDYAVVRMDVESDSYEVIYHEYIHKLLELNFARLPVWLNEGLAEFYGTTAVRGGRTILGAPSARLYLLRRGTPYPLSKFLTAGRNSAYYNSEDKVAMYYAEAWGLTHFLTFGKDMGNGVRMNDFLRKLQLGVEEQTAFREAFGDPEVIKKEFETYINRLAFSGFIVQTPAKIKEDNLPTRELSAAEADAVLGSFYSYTGNQEVAKNKLDAALSENPKLWQAHENLAFLEFREGREQDAKGEFDQALALNPQAYLSLYYRSELAARHNTDAESLGNLNTAMVEVERLNPRFAPAYVAQSRIYAQQGKFNEALAAANKAAELEPDRAGYITNVARILIAGKYFGKASEVARYVAGRWERSDRAEALEVLDEARTLGKITPSEDEKKWESDLMQYAEGTSATRGVIQSVTCKPSPDKDAGGRRVAAEVVLQSDDRTIAFPIEKGLSTGWSDTLWYGSDHFTPCHYLEGRHAVARYKEEPGKPPELRWLEIRDDLEFATPPKDAVAGNK